MITDTMLYEAAAIAAIKINDSLPEPDQCTHKFSMRFEKKIKRATRRANHPIVFRMIQTAACFALIVLVGFGSVITVNAEVRDAFLNWIKKTVGETSVYFTLGDERKVDITQDGSVYITDGESEQLPIQDTEYQMDWIPEGFVLNPVSGNGLMMYNGQNDRILVFEFSAPSLAETVVVHAEEANVSKVKVNGVPADLYLEENVDDLSALFWMDPETEYLLSITGNVTKEELLRMAESVRIVK